MRCFKDLIGLSILLSIPAVSAQEQQRHLSCNPPANGCKNGLWSTTTCTCQCIPPFCPDWITGGGACTSPLSNCGGNPWINCNPTIKKSCPWWNSMDAAGVCTSGPSVPPGIWLVYESMEECCAVHHPESSVCDPNVVKKEVIAVTAPSVAPTRQQMVSSSNGGYDDSGVDNLYEVVVPIQFTLQRLPEGVDVDVEEVRDEMFAVLEKALSNMEGLIEGLMIESVQEKLELTTAATSDEVVVYYEVTVARQQSLQEYGPMIIANLRESYGNAVDEGMGDHVYLGLTKLKYFGAGVNLLWCTSKTTDDAFDLCAETDETVTIKFRLSHVPSQGLDVELLIQEMIGIYQDVLLLELEDDEDNVIVPIDELDITGIEYKWIDLPSSVIKEDDDARDVFLDIKIARSNKLLGTTTDELGKAINEKIQSHKGTVILSRIQEYTNELDESMDLELQWCVDGEGAYNAKCPVTGTTTPSSMEAAKEDSTTSAISKFAVDNWVIITITVLSVITACCLCKCIAAFLSQREDSKQERNMVNYIYTGQNYSKPPKPPSQKRKKKKKRKGVAPSKQRRREFEEHEFGYHQRTRYPRRPASPAQKPRKSHHRHSSKKHEEMKKLTNSPYHPDTTNQQLVLKQKQQRLAQRLASRQQALTVPKRETEYQLEQMPTFVFPYDKEDLGLQVVRRDEDLTNDADADNELFMIENGTWYVDNDP